MKETTGRLAGGHIRCWVSPTTTLQVDLLLDPNGHRLELAADTATPEMNASSTR